MAAKKWEARGSLGSSAIGTFSIPICLSIAINDMALRSRNSNVGSSNLDGIEVRVFSVAEGGRPSECDS